MSEYLIQGETLTNIADAIREKKGTSDVILVSAFADEISTIETGGGGGGGNMLTANTEEEMLALITEENIGQFIYYNGVTGTYVNGEYYKVVEDNTPNARYCQLYDLPYSATASDIAVGKQAFNGKGGLITGTGVMTGQLNRISYILGVQDSIFSSYTLSPEDFGGLLELKSNAFARCYGLMGAELPNTCKIIGSFGFYYCSHIKHISGISTTSIGNNAFEYCSSLSSAYFPNLEIAGSSCFRCCSSLAMADFPMLTSAGKGMFQYCSKLSVINAPKLTQIPADFAYSAPIYQVEFPLATEIGTYAFAYCSSLSSANLPKAKVLGASCFGSTNLQYISMPVVETIGASAFWTARLSHITIPSACTYIGSYAFYIGRSHTIRVEATTPPSITNTTLNTGQIIELQVPPNCLESYQTASYWSAVSAKMVEYIE